MGTTQGQGVMHQQLFWGRGAGAGVLGTGCGSPAPTGAPGCMAGVKESIVPSPALSMSRPPPAHAQLGTTVPPHPWGGEGGLSPNDGPPHPRGGRRPHNSHLNSSIPNYNFSSAPLAPVIFY